MQVLQGQNLKKYRFALTTRKGSCRCRKFGTFGRGAWGRFSPMASMYSVKYNRAHISNIRQMQVSSERPCLSMKQLRTIHPWLWEPLPHWVAMAPHSSTLAWKIPWTEEPGGLQSMGSLGVGHDWATSLSFFTFMHWRRKWQPTPVFLPREPQGRGSLVGFRLWGCTESDTTEAT